MTEILHFFTVVVVVVVDVKYLSAVCDCMCERVFYFSAAFARRNICSFHHIKPKKMGKYFVIDILVPFDSMSSMVSTTLILISP